MDVMGWYPMSLKLCFLPKKLSRGYAKSLENWDPNIYVEMTMFVSPSQLLVEQQVALHDL